MEKSTFEQMGGTYPHRNPAKRFRWGEEVQGSGRSFPRSGKRRQADFALTRYMGSPRRASSSLIG